MAEQEKIPIRCCVTGKEQMVLPKADGTPKLPLGWKDLAGRAYSSDGWEQTFFPRTIELPVASVALGYLDDATDWSPAACEEAWRAFRKALREGCRQAAQVVNVLLWELARLDCLPLETGPKGRKLPPLSLPSAAVLQRLLTVGREQFPEIDSQSMGCLRNEAYAHYKRHRWEIRILCKRSMPSYRDENPLPVPASVYRFHMHERQAFVQLRLQGQRFTLRLANGYRFERKVAALEKAVQQTAKLGELSLYFRAQGATHRNGGKQRKQPGSNQRQTLVYAGFAIHLPKTPGERTAAQMHIRTTEECLFEVLVGNRQEPWLLHDEHIGRAIAQHRRRLQELSDDQKMERRLPRANRADINGYRETLVLHQQRRMDDYLKKAAALVAGLASRHHVSEVFYDDRIQTRWESFQWFMLRTRVEQKLGELKIKFTHITATDEAAEA